MLQINHRIVIVTIHGYRGDIARSSACRSVQIVRLRTIGGIGSVEGLRGRQGDGDSAGSSIVHSCQIGLCGRIPRIEPCLRAAQIDGTRSRPNIRTTYCEQGGRCLRGGISTMSIRRQSQTDTNRSHLTGWRTRLTNNGTGVGRTGNGVYHQLQGNRGGFFKARSIPVRTPG